MHIRSIKLRRPYIMGRTDAGAKVRIPSDLLQQTDIELRFIQVRYNNQRLCRSGGLIWVNSF